MTLEAYDADRLDETALRILEIAAAFRGMAQTLRQEPAIDLAIHHRKAAEWLSHLERWAAESRAKLDVALIKRRGAKKAEQFSAE
jgi:hypothetical protein